MPANRRNVSFTDENIDKFLDEEIGQGNVSGYIQDAIRFYRIHQSKEYATKEDLNKITYQYLELKHIVSELIAKIML